MATPQIKWNPEIVETPNPLYNSSVHFYLHVLFSLVLQHWE